MARVIDVRTDEKSRADQALADARRRLHIAQREVEAAKVEAGAAAQAAADLQEAAKTLQSEMQKATLRADHERLAAALEENQRQQRLANFAVHSTSDAQTEAEQRAADRAAAVEAAQAAATWAARAYDDAGKQEELFASWRTALTAAATRRAVDEAQTEKDGAHYTTARDRLARLLGGEEMLDVYRQRTWFAAENVAQPGNLFLDALRKAAEARSESEPLLSARMGAAAELAVWVDCIQDAAEGTVTRLASARKVLVEQARRDPDEEAREPLRSNLARMSERAQDVLAAGVPAKELDYFNKVRALHDAQATAQRELLTELAEDPDAAADEATAAVRTAQEEANAAEAAYNDVKAALDAYEVAVPPEVLADVVAFFEADMTIDRVKDVDANEISSRLETAEAAYANAEQADVRERRAVALVDARVESRRRRRTASTGSAAAHRLLTVRGDR